MVSEELLMIGFKVTYIIEIESVTFNNHITCGLPQGSILVPLLFLLYVDDIVEVRSVLLSILYADDISYF